jgi:hypothetical protein
VFRRQDARKAQNPKGIREMFCKNLPNNMKIQTYDGPGVIVGIELDAFYGRDADGYRYDVRLDAGRVGSYDRTRVQPA